MKTPSILTLLAAALFLSMQPASAANITCQFNQATGKLEASLAWKNVLGDEADRACERVVPGAQIQASPSAAVSPDSGKQALPMSAKIAPAAPAAPVAVAAAAAAPAINIPQKPIVKLPTWKVELKDVTLSNTFFRWAEPAGWRVRWDADKNILVDAPDAYTSTFEDAITSVLSSPGIARGSYPLEVCFYANTPPLARITRKGEQKDCK